MADFTVLFGVTCEYIYSLYPVAANLGPHKVITYVGGSGGILLQKSIELTISKMAFRAFREQNLKTTNHFFFSVPLFLRKYWYKASFPVIAKTGSQLAASACI